MRPISRLSSSIRGYFGAISIAVVAAGSGGMALAQSGPAVNDVRPSVAKGQEIAGRFCKNCHLMEGSTPATVTPGIPSFKAIANKKGQTGRHIRDVLIQPHQPMPDLQLSNEEILNILTYLDSLRADPASPSFLDQPDGQKPAYPRQG